MEECPVLESRMLKDWKDQEIFCICHLMLISSIDSQRIRQIPSVEIPAYVEQGWHGCLKKRVVTIEVLDRFDCKYLSTEMYDIIRFKFLHLHLVTKESMSIRALSNSWGMWNLGSELYKLIMSAPCRALRENRRSPLANNASCISGSNNESNWDFFFLNWAIL